MFSETKGLSCVTKDLQKMPLENGGLFAKHFLKTKRKPVKKNTGCFSTQLKTTTTRHQAWFCTHPFNYKI